MYGGFVMKGKHVFYTEAAYCVGLLLLAIGTAFIEKGNFGMGAIVAPAYLLHLKLSQYSSFFTFGVCEYLFQGLLIILIILITRKAKLGYLFSFVTALLYGLTLDGVMMLIGNGRPDSISLRIASFAFGMVVCGIGVAFLLRTYLAPEAYELIVKELSEHFRMDIGKVKTGYDIISCVAAVIMSFVFFGFGQFYGIQVGTIVSALINGSIISYSGKLLDQHFEFRDGLKLRDLFSK